MRNAKFSSIMLFFIFSLSMPSFAEMKAAPPEIMNKYQLTLQQPIVDGKFVFLNGVHNFGSKSTRVFDWGDGTIEVGKFPGKHLYQNPGTYTITRTITEDTADGRVVKTAKTSVTIQEIKLAPPEILNKYQLTLHKPSVHLRFVSLNGVHNFGPSSKRSFDWGDGTLVYGKFPGRHIYENPGTYTITRTITEDTPDGRVVKTAKTSVTIQEIKLAPPEILNKYKLTLRQPIIDGRSVTLNGEHNFGPSSKLSFGWGDGTFEDGAFPGKHIYKSPGTYEIVLVATENTPLGSVEQIEPVTVIIK